MAKFPILSDLPHNTQVEIARIQGIASGQRTTGEAAYLTALAAYLTNEVIRVDAAGLILEATGLSVPTGKTGFRKGALFTDTDAVAGGLYQNTGDETSATWALLAKGDTGTAGGTGAKGDTGTTGAKGDTGVKGDTGA